MKQYDHAWPYITTTHWCLLLAVVLLAWKMYCYIDSGRLPSSSSLCSLLRLCREEEEVPTQNVYAALFYLSLLPLALVYLHTIPIILQYLHYSAAVFALFCCRKSKCKKKGTFQLIYFLNLSILILEHRKRSLHCF